MSAVKLDLDTGWPWPVIDLDREILLDAHRRCVQAGVKYGLGAKAPTLNSQPGSDFRKIDCSGMVRWLIWQAGHRVFPDGSWVQHKWCRDNALKKSSVDAGARKDGVVRIAFLAPGAMGPVGHVSLILEGWTLESHGGVGPNRRQWKGTGWQRLSTVYVLDLEQG